MALMPVAGDVDCVVAAELVEAGRAMARGLVTPERTTLIASSHREYTISERSAMGSAVDRSRTHRYCACPGKALHPIRHGRHGREARQRDQRRTARCNRRQRRAAVQKRGISKPPSAAAALPSKPISPRSRMLSTTAAAGTVDEACSNAAAAKLAERNPDDRPARPQLQELLQRLQGCCPLRCSPWRSQGCDA